MAACILGSSHVYVAQQSCDQISYREHKRHDVVAKRPGRVLGEKHGDTIASLATWRNEDVEGFREGPKDSAFCSGYYDCLDRIQYVLVE